LQHKDQFLAPVALQEVIQVRSPSLFILTGPLILPTAIITPHSEGD
jgi:hypothetical protein